MTVGLKRRGRRKLLTEMNVVPYVDVMLVLLIIFMVTAPLLQQGVSVELPRASANPLPPENLEPLVLSVNKDGEYFLNIADKPNEPLEAEPLVVRVAAELKNHPERKVVVKGDTNVDYGKVVGAMVLLQHAGAPSVGLITENLTH